MRTGRSARVLGAAIAWVVVGATGVSAGCGDSDGDVACTLIGCYSGAAFDLSAYPFAAGSTVTACVEDVCTEWVTTGDSSLRVLPHVSLGDNREVAFDSVRVTAIGPTGEAVLHASIDGLEPGTFQPNGPRCSPTCRAVQLRLTSSGRLEPVP